MTTARDIITLALKDAGVVGVGQTPAAEDINDALTRLNYMIGQWNRKRWLIWHLLDISCPVTSGQVAYTVGTGGDFDCNRPDRIESAFLRQIVSGTPGEIDYPLNIIQAREDYNVIALKELASWPQYIFYDSAYPTGTLYVYPTTVNGSFELHISIKDTLAQFTSLTQTVNLPPEYESAIHYNLAARLRPAYQMPPDPTLTALAVENLNVIRGANTQLPILRMPKDLVGNGYIYNYYSGQ